MITSIYIGSERVDNTKRYLQGISNLTFPTFAATAAKRASFEGVNLAVGKFNSFKFATEWLLLGDDPSDLATQREDFAELMGSIFIAGSQTFKLNKDNSVGVQIEVKSAKITGDLTPKNYHHSIVLVEFEAEYPFLQSQTLQSEDISIFTGGGMAIPMGIPMSMSAGATNEVTVTNGGNYKAYPIITFYGTLNNPSLSNLTNGQELSLSYELATSNDYIVIDTFERTALLYPSGINVRQYVGGDFITFDAGDNLLHLANTTYNGIGYCNVQFRDHYLGI